MLKMVETLVHAVNGSDGNNSTANSLRSEGKVKLIGYPGPWFAAIHISALISISISTLVSAGLIMYLCGCTCRRKPSEAKTIKEQNGNGKQTSDGKTGAITQRRKPAPGNMQHIRYFWKWNVGERFVLYLAACDVGFGISHSIDHIYIYHFVDHPPDRLCAFVGFLLHQFVVGQSFVVTICAVSACSLVVFGKKISLGRWDWRLFAFAFFLPFVVGIFGIAYEMLGASGGSCSVHVGTMAGLHYYIVITVFQIVLYGVVAVAYAAIWFKIRRTTKLLEESSTKRYQNSARLMLIFVAVFIFQWWSLTFLNIWILIDRNPPPAILVIVAILINFGGVYNCFAYTIIRRRLQKQATNSGANVVMMCGNKKPKQNALDRAPKTTAAATSVILEVNVEDTTAEMDPPPPPTTTTTTTTSETPVTIEETTTEMAATTGTADSSEQHRTIRL